MFRSTISTNSGHTSYLDYAIVDNAGLYMAAIFDSAASRANAVCAYINLTGVPVITLETEEGRRNISCPYEYRATASKVASAHSYYVYNAVYAENSKTIVTSEETIHEDLYHYFMNEYTLPLLHDADWMEYILRKGKEYGYLKIRKGQECVYCNDMTREIELSGKKVCLENIVVIHMKDMTEEGLKSIMTEGAKSGDLSFTQDEVKKLEVEGLDDYLGQFADSIVKNTSANFNPMTGYAGAVRGLALKVKKLFPQQAMCVNAMKALKKSGSKYGFIIAEMGTGKTAMGESFVESYFVEKAMDRYHLSAEEVYRKPELVNYRAIIMAPGHLVNTWKSDIEKEIPYAKVEIITELSQLIAIREKRNVRSGREFYILGKDFAKLGSSYAPIPTKVRESLDYKVQVCEDCASVSNYVVKRYGEKRCPKCNGKRWKKYTVGLAGKQGGMTCPHCSELLISGGRRLTLNMEPEEAEATILRPSSFRAHRSSNDICYHCGNKLWGTDAAIVNADNEFHKMADRKPKWYKVSEWSSFSKKDTKTAFALKGYEQDAYERPELGLGDAMYRKTRKVAPAEYIKKYLKGAFDICILDEVHKFEGAGTAQSVAAAAIVGASKFTLGLTGTLTNGTAASLFYLLYMLDPVRMQEKGYAYDGVTEFVRKYGTMETRYRGAGMGDDDQYKQTGRGRMIGQPKIKPGISPLIYSEYLLDKAVFLSITDFSNFLPKFTENVVLVDENPEVIQSYKDTMGQLKRNLRTKPGHAAAMAGLLQCGLSYTDKPYGRSPIMSTKVKDYMVAEYDDLRAYAEPDRLLEKEKKLVELVRNEIAEDRNIFIYAVYTGKAESNISYRLQEVLERHCNLKGAVQVMEAGSPSSAKRAEWIHKKASEGVRVFICNPSLVETGLDFKFDYKGKTYNYPTIIFYQLDYKLATFWQAGRRAFRLNQTEECRNYYFATAGTAQTVALKVMADKQLSASALQGNFSAEGLAAMSSSVDAKTQLTKMLIEGSSDTGEDLASMFDVLNEANNADTMDSAIMEEYRGVKNFYELTGLNTDSGEEEVASGSLFDFIDQSLLTTVKSQETISIKPSKPKAEETIPVKKEEEELPKVDFASMFGFNAGGFGFGSLFDNSNSSEGSLFDSIIKPAAETEKKPKKEAKKKAKTELSRMTQEAQMSFGF